MSEDSEEIKTIHLPSGRTAKIRKLDTRGYKKVYRASGDDEVTIAEKLMIELCEDPKLAIVAEGGKPPNGAIDVNDLPLADYLMLSAECTRFSGLTEVLNRISPLLEALKMPQDSIS